MVRKRSCALGKGRRSAGDSRASIHGRGRSVQETEMLNFFAAYRARRHILGLAEQQPRQVGSCDSPDLMCVVTAQERAL